MHVDIVEHAMLTLPCNIMSMSLPRTHPVHATDRYRMRPSPFSLRALLFRMTAICVPPCFPPFDHSCTLPRILMSSAAPSMDRHDILEATHDTIARSYLDVEIVLEDMVLVLLSVRFYIRIVAFCMVFTALIALAAYLQTLPSIFQTSDFVHAAMLRVNSQTAYLHSG